MEKKKYMVTPTLMPPFVCFSCRQLRVAPCNLLSTRTVPRWHSDVMTAGTLLRKRSFLTIMQPLHKSVKKLPRPAFASAPRTVPPLNQC